MSDQVVIRYTHLAGVGHLVFNIVEYLQVSITEPAECDDLLEDVPRNRPDADQGSGRHVPRRGAATGGGQ